MSFFFPSKMTRKRKTRKTTLKKNSYLPVTSSVTVCSTWILGLTSRK